MGGNTLLSIFETWASPPVLAISVKRGRRLLLLALIVVQYDVKVHDELTIEAWVYLSACATSTRATYLGELFSLTTHCLSKGSPVLRLGRFKHICRYIIIQIEEGPKKESFEFFIPSFSC